jgi:small subunit ribosomal protein S21
MLKIEVKKDESIDRALKRYKRKRRSTKLVEEIRERREFTKDSVKRRKSKEKATYREQYLNQQDNY